MTDDEMLQHEADAVRAYFSHRVGQESDRPLSDVVAALMRHCLVGTREIT